MNKEKQLYKNYKSNNGNCKMYNQKRALSNLKKSQAWWEYFMIKNEYYLKKRVYHIGKIMTT